jgi:hypothetical protein
VLIQLNIQGKEIMSNKDNTTKSPAPSVAKQHAQGDDTPYEFTRSDGVIIKICSVSTALIDEVSNSVKDPPIPMWHNPEYDRDEEQPNDPTYLVALKDNNRQRGVAAIDALAMFGVELVNGLPQNTDWIKKLQYLAKKGRLNLTDYDMADQFDLEFLYKRYIVVDNAMLAKISSISGITPMDVAEAERSFQS